MNEVLRVISFIREIVQQQLGGMLIKGTLIVVVEVMDPFRILLDFPPRHRLHYI